MGGMAVEIFFFFSGYYMVTSYFKNKGTSDEHIENSKDFVKKKILFFYPHYIVSFFMVFLAKNIIQVSKYPGIEFVKQLIRNMFDAIPEILGIYMFGFTEGALYNQPAWYIVCMIISMAVVYYLLSKNDKLFLFFAPLIGLFIMAWRYNNTNDFMIYEWRTVVGVIPYGIIRATCDLCLGVFAFVMVEYINRLYITNVSRFLLSGAELTGWILLIMSTQIIDIGDGKRQIICIFLAWIIVVLSLSNISCLNLLFERFDLGILSKIGFSLYMTHYVSLILVKHYWRSNRSYFQNLPLFCIICGIAVITEIFIVKWCNDKIIPRIIRTNDM